MSDETCDRCNELADTHIETMTRSECLCAHCARVAFGLILAPPVEAVEPTVYRQTLSGS